MKKFISNSKIYYVIGVLLLFVLWQIVSMIIDSLLFPSPINVFKEFFILLGKSYTYNCILKSLTKMLIGFGIAFVLGLIFGIISSRSEKIENMFSPLMTTLKAVPTACVVFLFIALSGANNAPIYVVILVSFPILYEGVKGGIKNIDQSIKDAVKLESNSFIKNVFHIYLPLAMSYILVSFASSLALSFKIVIMAEVITGSTNPGLGSSIVVVQRLDPTNMTSIFAYGLIAIVISMVFDLGLTIVNRKAILK